MQDNIEPLIVNFGDNYSCGKILVDQDNNGEDDEHHTKGIVSVS
jgi:hypothetical protein